MSNLCGACYVVGGNQLPSCPEPLESGASAGAGARAGCGLAGDTSSGESSGKAVKR
jgi:hypothetical protein